MAPRDSLAFGQLVKRGVQEDLASLPETLGNWDKCMEKSWCKYPLIASFVVGALILVSIIWCCYRCCCRRSRKADRSKSTFFNDPIPAYMSNPPAQSGGYNNNSSNNIPSSNNHSASSGNGPTVPQFAYFESGTTTAKLDNDDLPVMPSWNGAKNEKVEDTTAKVEAIELGEVDNGRHQPSGSTPPSSNPHLPPVHYNNQPPRPNFHNHPPPNLNPFGPQRLNSPFRPGGGPPNGFIPPNRTQSPYPESHNMPTANIPPSNPLDAFDFNPHINAQNQGPYANAEIYSESSYNHQQTGVTQPQFSGTTTTTPMAPQLSGTTSPPPPFQQPTYTGTTIAGETYTPTPPPQGLFPVANGLPNHPTSPTPPPPTVFNTSGTTANGFNPANNPPPQRADIPLPQNSNGGFVAQMDDDYGHSPVHLTHAAASNAGANPPGFSHNDFDHGGYSAYNPNQGNYQRF